MATTRSPGQFALSISPNLWEALLIHIYFALYALVPIPKQGVVHWPPPPEAIQAVVQALGASDPTLSQYGANEGLPVLRQALKKKVQSTASLLTLP